VRSRDACVNDQAPEDRIKPNSRIARPIAATQQIRDDNPPSATYKTGDFNQQTDKQPKP